jgi:hypothetical protein
MCHIFKQEFSGFINSLMGHFQLIKAKDNNKKYDSSCGDSHASGTLERVERDPCPAPSGPDGSAPSEQFSQQQILPEATPIRLKVKYIELGHQSLIGLHAHSCKQPMKARTPRILPLSL